MTTNAVTIAQFTDTVYATELEREFQRELRPHRIFYNFMRHAPAGNSTVFTFVTLDDAGATVQDITEGSTDLATANWTDVTTTGVTATTAQHGVFTLVTDLLKVVSILDVAPVVAGALGRTIAEAYDVACQAVIDNFANTTGSATTGSLARVLSAISTLEARDVGSTGESLVQGLHAKQWGDIRADIASNTAAFLANPSTALGRTLGPVLDGFVGEVFGVPTFISTTISSASSAYQGWIMASGKAYGDYNLWLERPAIQRDESKVSDEVIVTSCYGFALIDDNRVQGVRSTT